MMTAQSDAVYLTSQNGWDMPLDPYQPRKSQGVYRDHAGQNRATPEGRTVAAPPARAASPTRRGRPHDIRLAGLPALLGGNEMPDEMRQRWCDLLRRWAVDSVRAEGRFEEVRRLYAGPGRFYHTIGHVRGVLETVER